MTPDDQALIDAAMPLAEAGTQMGASRERAILGRAFILLHAENTELRCRVRELGELAEDQFRLLEGRQPKARRKPIGEKEKKT